MLYYANPSTEAIRDAMSAGLLGCISTPGQGNRLPDKAKWVADNGCYGKGWPGEAIWKAWLEHSLAAYGKCEFATAPDVVADAKATLARSTPCLPYIHSLGIKPAFVAQDGVVPDELPWDDFDVLFVGGSDLFKLGPAGFNCAQCAKSKGKHVHMGRVNSFQRLCLAYHMGCDSVDGTYLTFGPDTNLPKLLSMLRQLNNKTIGGFFL